MQNSFGFVIIIGQWRSRSGTQHFLRPPGLWHFPFGFFTLAWKLGPKRDSKRLASQIFSQLLGTPSQKRNPMTKIVADGSADALLQATKAVKIAVLIALQLLCLLGFAGPVAPALGSVFAVGDGIDGAQIMLLLLLFYPCIGMYSFGGQPIRITVLRNSTFLL
jgi:hypothetical protein